MKSKLRYVNIDSPTEVCKFVDDNISTDKLKELISITVSFNNYGMDTYTIWWKQLTNE